MAQARKKSAPKRKAASKDKKNGLATVRKQTLTIAGGAVKRAGKNIGVTRQRLVEALYYTSTQLARMEMVNAQSPFNRINRAIQAFCIPAQEEAKDISMTFSGQARLAWNRLSKSKARGLTSDMLELGGQVPGAGVSPLEEEMVLFAVRVAENDERRFRKVLDAFGIELTVASRVITNALENELTGKSNSAPGKKAPVKKGK